MSKAAIFTIVSNNYLHFARTLLQSVKQHHSESDLFCVVVDADLSHSHKLSSEFNTIYLKDLAISDLENFKFQYTVLELNTAVKPWSIEFLLNKGYESVIYIDPDIYLYKPLNEVFSALQGNADIVITPHLLGPINDDKSPSELDIRRAGTYNFGFCAVKKSDNTLRFLQWWQKKLTRDCIVDVDRGIFVDQSWIDLVPGLFNNVYILRHQGYNVAYWNIAQRSVVKIDGSWKANNDHLIFFHFSGFDPFKPSLFSKHQNRFTLDTLGPAKELVTNYAEALITNGAEHYSKLNYGFSFFKNGESIPNAVRRAFLKNEIFRKILGDDPFSQHEELLEQPIHKSITSEIPLTWAMLLVWESRSDLQQHFDLKKAQGVEKYWSWFLAEGRNYYTDITFHKHTKIWDSFQKSIKSTESIEQSLESTHYNSKKILFSQMMGRDPGPRAINFMTKFNKLPFGDFLIILSLSMTKESRNLGNSLNRIKTTTKRLIIKKKNDFIPGKIINTPHAYMGIYSSDIESSMNGIWCDQTVHLPIPSISNGSIEIKGRYPIEYYSKSDSTPSITLSLNGEVVYHKLFVKNDIIDIKIKIPTHLSNAKILSIFASNSFNPSELGLGNDQRQLSWRIKHASVNDINIVNCNDSNSLKPLADIYKIKGINLVGYLASEHGVGEAARVFANAAKVVGIDYSITDIGYQSMSRQADRSAWKNASNDVFDVDIIYANADQTPNTLIYLKDKGLCNSKYRIGFWHWEQPKLPESFLPNFQGLDEIWVPTAFVQEAISTIAPIPVFKVPHAIDFKVPKGWSREYFGIPANKFAVLVMYDFHSYRYRKNPESSIAAFKIAARYKKDLCLVIKTINSEKYPDDFASLKRDVADLESVIFLNEVFSRDKLYALESSCDCMLSLHRAEGFGLGPAEMMFLGKPVIATGWSGNMEFMNTMNSFPVNYTLKPLNQDLGIYSKGLDWAEADIEHAAFYLQKIHDDPSLAKKIGAIAEQTMKTRFSPNFIGQLYKERLSLIRSFI